MVKGWAPHMTGGLQTGEVCATCTCARVCGACGCGVWIRRTLPVGSTCLPATGIRAAVQGGAESRVWMRTTAPFSPAFFTCLRAAHIRAAAQSGAGTSPPCGPVPCTGSTACWGSQRTASRQSRRGGRHLHTPARAAGRSAPPRRRGVILCVQKGAQCGALLDSWLALVSSWARRKPLRGSSPAALPDLGAAANRDFAAASPNLKAAALGNTLAAAWPSPGGGGLHATACRGAAPRRLLRDQVKLPAESRAVAGRITVHTSP
eukprot:350660-Chlamydomonas_euryale.AAC.6